MTSSWRLTSCLNPSIQSPLYISYNSSYYLCYFFWLALCFYDITPCSSSTPGWYVSPHVPNLKPVISPHTHQQGHEDASKKGKLDLRISGPRPGRWSQGLCGTCHTNCSRQNMNIHHIWHSLWLFSVERATWILIMMKSIDHRSDLYTYVPDKLLRKCHL